MITEKEYKTHVDHDAHDLKDFANWLKNCIKTKYASHIGVAIYDYPKSVPKKYNPETVNDQPMKLEARINLKTHQFNPFEKPMRLVTIDLDSKLTNRIFQVNIETTVDLYEPVKGWVKMSLADIRRRFQREKIRIFIKCSKNEVIMTFP